jgi:hypothetical protein
MELGENLGGPLFLCFIVFLRLIFLMSFQGVTHLPPFSLFASMAQLITV